MSTPHLKTKLNIPPQRPNLVLRPRLMELLEAGRHQHHCLTLVSAKAGSGKTTLISEWVHQKKRPAAWLSLDAKDNDPRRFISYLVAAIHQIDIPLDPAVLDHLEAPQLPPADVVVSELVTHLADTTFSFLLIFDDYHLIQEEWIHQAVAFLVQHLPADIHLVLISRTDPPLPLARLRGRNLLTEIRDDHLRFTPGEVVQFVTEVMELDLPPEAISTLEGRTEGWIAGLQLATISVKGRIQESSLGEFIEAFGGTNRYILDYLMEEVLNQQTQDIQDFLIETSILERLCGELCDVVRFGDQEEGHHGRGASQAILEQLERTNLFLLPLDEERRWYRYHHLFADLLHSTRKQLRSEEQNRELHRRASLWHQRSGTLEEAMTHAMAAQDFDRAAGMIDENITSMLSRSEAPVLLSWIRNLPESIVRDRPWIDVYHANTLALSGRLEEALRLLDGVEMQMDPEAPRASEVLGHTAAIRAYAANLAGDAARVLEMAKLTDQYLDGWYPNARGMVAYALAETYFARDDMDGAYQASTDMLDVGEKTGRLLMAIPALCDLAAVKKVQGKLHQAERFYSRAHQWMFDRSGLNTRVRCPYEVGLADLLREWNQLDAAHEHAVTGIEYCQRYGVYSLLLSGYIAFARILQAQGDQNGALDALHKAEQVRQTHPVRLASRIEFQTYRVDLSLKIGDIDAAASWARELENSEPEQIMMARLLLAQGHVSKAVHLLDQLQINAREGGRIGRLIEIMALQAFALTKTNQPREARAVLTQALSLARPEGYMRLFLDLGFPLCDLLDGLASQIFANPQKRELSVQFQGDYIRVLLDAFRQEKLVQPGGRTEPSITLLTEREIEVLQLLAEGLSNKTIAQRLVVAPSTIKQHLKNIYSKLDVHNRTQAVARGRELELL